MAFTVDIPIMLGNVAVQTTEGRGFTPEEIAERALDKIIYVGSNADPVLRDQATVFRDQIRAVLIFYLNQAVQSHNTTIANKLVQAGHPELVPLIK